MTQYFVRKTGNDTTGDGSTGLPWLTWGKGKTTVSIAGDHNIKFGNGTYVENEGSGYGVLNRNFVKEVVFESESGNPEDVIFTSASGAYNFFQNGPIGNMRFKNVTIKGRSGAIDCLTYNQQWPFTNIIFENVIFDVDGLNVNGRGIGAASSTPASAIQQNFIFINCRMKASGGVAGFGARLGLNSAAPAGTNLRAEFYNCRADDLSLNVGVEAGPGVTCYIYGGKYLGVSGKGIIFAQDGQASGVPTRGGIFGADIRSVSAHAFLIGGDCNDVVARGVIARDGDHATVIKAAQRTKFIHNISIAGTINALLTKGCDYGEHKYNTLVSEPAGGDAVLANYDGDPAYVCVGNLYKHNKIIMRGGSTAIRWNPQGDGGQNVLTGNAYRDRRPNRSLSYGTVLSALTTFSVADIHNAFVAGGQPENEKGSGSSVPMVRYRHSETGVQLYGLIYDGNGDILTHEGFVLPRLNEVGFLSQAVIPFYEEVAGSKVYEFPWPTELPNNDYKIEVFKIDEWGFPSMNDEYLSLIEMPSPSQSKMLKKIKSIVNFIKLRV